VTPPEPIIVCAHRLRIRAGQPGHVVIETTDRTPRLAFLFDLAQAEDFAERLWLLAEGCETEA
jgi:hypothetical protein